MKRVLTFISILLLFVFMVPFLNAETKDEILEGNLSDKENSNLEEVIEPSIQKIDSSNIDVYIEEVDSFENSYSYPVNNEVSDLRANSGREEIKIQNETRSDVEGVEYETYIEDTRVRYIDGKIIDMIRGLFVQMVE